MDADGTRVSCCALSPVSMDMTMGCMLLIVVAGIWLIGVF